jgi:hypothetical protein
MSAVFFPWKDAYSVYIVEIDNQHKAITEMLQGKRVGVKVKISHYGMGNCKLFPIFKAFK